MLMNRRNLFKSWAKVSTAMAITPFLTACAGGNRKKIDVHHHALPPVYLDALSSLGINSSGGVPFPTWTPEKSLNVMRFNGITSAVLSLSSPGTYFGDAAFSARLSRQVNDYLADVVAKHPRNFGFFATLPAPAISESLIEADYAFKALNADGVCLLASSGGVFLGDPSQDELLSYLNEQQATVFIHPNQHPTTDQLGLNVPLFAVEFVLDTTRAVANMIWNGTFERFPNIRWILAHAGGTVPYIAWRMSLLDLKFPELRERSPKGTMHYLKQLYYDTALSPSENSLFPLLNQFGLKQMLLGTDYPFAPAPLVPLELLELNRATYPMPGFTPTDVAQLHENGYALFPRLQKLHSEPLT